VVSKSIFWNLRLKYSMHLFPVDPDVSQSLIFSALLKTIDVEAVRPLSDSRTDFFGNILVFHNRPAWHLLQDVLQDCFQTNRVVNRLGHISNRANTTLRLLSIFCQNRFLQFWICFFQTFAISYWITSLCVLSNFRPRLELSLALTHIHIFRWSLFHSNPNIIRVLLYLWNLDIWAMFFSDLWLLHLVRFSKLDPKPHLIFTNSHLGSNPQVLMLQKNKNEY